ncbi:MAG: LPS export ABC transporter periplasmic protein LptC [Alphaproteobacteria bacterium]|nr:LPS export ABC transporter periplasmic protein LptC [Alphaproteobacteria bacterium]
MQQNHRNLIIISKHKRLTRLWQFFFTGWGLVMVAILVATPFLTKQILWTPIRAVNMRDVITNQFKMTNASFSGTDKDGNPFKINAISGHQEYGKPDIVFLEKPSGIITRKTSKGKTTDKVSAISGQFNHKENILTLTGNVRINSSNGDKILTDKMVIRL